MDADPRTISQPAARLAVTGAVGSLACLTYFVLIGGGTLGELWPIPRLLGAGIATVFIAAYVWRVPLVPDRVDKGVLLSVLLFIGAALTSSFPRQSFDAALGALALAAALFIAREVLAVGRWRAWFVRLLIGLSLMLTLVTVARWIPLVMQSMSVTGALPSLSLDVPAMPWGHRYDLGLLIAMLYPAWWIGRPSPARRVAAGVVGLMVLGIVLISGSRTLWAALSLATLSLAWPIVTRHRTVIGRHWLPLVLATMGISAVVYITGMWEPLAQRLGTVESLGMRSAMWNPLLTAWSTHPVGGFGPGSFPWILQLTNYFDVNTWPPRHPDNAVVQLLVEGGVLGILSMLVVVVTVVPAVMRGTSQAARWSIIAFLVACLGGNPSDFIFVLVVAIAWVAYAVPRRVVEEVPRPVTAHPIRVATIAALMICVLAGGATQVAGFAYEEARLSVAESDLPDARASLDTAIALDPGMALYVRQRGILGYVQGNTKGAVADLERATQLNPADDLAWRSLALAYLADDRTTEGLAALSTALTLQRADPTNLLLMAALASQTGPPAEAIALLAEVVQSWPAIVGAPGWIDLLPESVTTADVVDVALARWERGLSTPELPLDQPLWLVAMADRQDLEHRALTDSGIGQLLGRATIATIRCDPIASELLMRASDGERRHPLYQLLRQRADSLNATAEGFPSGESDTMAAQMGTLNPFDENGILSSDVWGYRRYPIDWPAVTGGLPSPMEGLAHWTRSPRDAAQAAELEGRLTLCR